MLLSLKQDLDKLEQFHKWATKKRLEILNPMKKLKELAFLRRPNNSFILGRINPFQIPERMLHSRRSGFIFYNLSSGRGTLDLSYRVADSY